MNQWDLRVMVQSVEPQLRQVTNKWIESVLKKVFFFFWKKRINWLNQVQFNPALTHLRTDYGWINHWIGWFPVESVCPVQF